MAKLLNEFLPRFEGLTKEPEEYLSVQKKLAGNVTDLLKSLYDFTKDTENGEINNEALPELIIEDFDDEQIWQELELQNNVCSANLVADVAALVASKDRLKFPNNDNSVNNESLVDVSGIENGTEDEETDIEEDDSDGEAEDYSRKKKKKKRKALARVSEVDDKFFKLSEMEQFLEKEEKDQDVQDSSDESVDLFRTSDNDDREENENDMHYDDFFDEPHDEEMEKKDKKKKVRFAELSEDDDVNVGNIVEGKGEEEEEQQQEEENDEDYEFEKQAEKKRKDRKKNASFLCSSSDSGDEGQEVKSTLEARQDRIKNRIQQLEEQALAEKPWQMKGEISGSARPQNSLLEEAVEFDLTVRPAPVITEKTTLQLEDVIRQRVKDKAWDDVERKVKPVETANEYKKKLVLDHEKSKLSLAQVYEKEYLKQRDAAQADESEEKQEEETAEQKEVRSRISSLFAKLDALSNFHYTPRPPAPEIKIVSNVPAITLEEVTPATTSDAALLAPEEIKARPKGDLQGKGERTTTDKKRQRRQKKAVQRKKKQEREKREKIVEKLKPGLGNKYSKEKAMRDLEKVEKSGNVTRMQEKEDSRKAVKSSTAFFTRLQDDVKNHIKTKRNATAKTNNTFSIPAKRFKL